MAIITLNRKTVRNGNDPADVYQEGAIAIYLAQIKYPGNRRHAQLRARQRIYRWREKEWKWLRKREQLRDYAADEKDRQLFEVLLLREVLDMLPYAVREEALLALLDPTDRKIEKAGEKVRGHLPMSLRLNNANFKVRRSP